MKLSSKEIRPLTVELEAHEVPVGNLCGEGHLKCNLYS